MADDPKLPITLTPKAAAMVLQIHAEEVAGSDEPNRVLRLGVRGGGCSGYQHDLSFDTPRDTDETFVCHGVTFIVDPASLQFLAGTELDYEDGLKGSGFTFNNPNATRTCGCGESFSV